MGHGVWGMGYGAWGMGYGVWGMGLEMTNFRLGGIGGIKGIGEFVSIYIDTVLYLDTYSSTFLLLPFTLLLLIAL